MRELRSVLPYFRPYTKRLWLGLVCVFLANVFQIAEPYLIKLAIDGFDDPDVTASRIASLAGLIVGAALLGGVFRFGMRDLLNGISRRMEVDIRDDFLHRLLQLDATFYGGSRTGDLMSRATNDTLAVRMAVGPAVMYTVNTAVSFVFAATLMLLLSPRLTLYAMVPLLILPPLVLRFGRIIHQRFEQIQEQFSSLSTFVQENLTGVRIIRAYTQEREQERQFEAFNEEYRHANMSLVLRAGAFHPSLGLVSGMAAVAVLWLGGIEVMGGRMSIGDFVAFGMYLSLLIWPMIALGWVVNLYQRGAASMGRLNAILQAEPSVRVPEHPRSIAEASGRIEFDGVGFAYPGTEREVLSDISFVAEPGELVAVVGPTGSGKSTLMALLTRLYDPTRGEIRIDGTPLVQLDPAALRARIGMVPQDTFLFSAPIVGNLGLGLDDSETLLDDGTPVDAILRAASTARLHDQIVAFPHGYETMLGERGINLSGGQKQRATLARAIARDPLILVLDDALSAVDTHTESEILRELRSAMVGRTSFIISHRVSAVMNADQILVLERGVIVERGTHPELLAADGTYARLLRRQLLEEQLESELAGASPGD